MMPDKKFTESGPLYDVVHLSGFTGGDKALEMEILSEFCKNMRESLARIQNRTEERSWGEAFHRLKGAARAVGVWSIANWCDQAEECEPSSLKEKQAYFDQILTVITLIERHIQAKNG